MFFKRQLHTSFPHYIDLDLKFGKEHISETVKKPFSKWICTYVNSFAMWGFRVGFTLNGYVVNYCCQLSNFLNLCRSHWANLIHWLAENIRTETSFFFLAHLKRGSQIDFLIITRKLTNRMWFSVVCTLIDKDMPHHSVQNVVDSRSANFDHCYHACRCRYECIKR